MISRSEKRPGAVRIAHVADLHFDRKHMDRTLESFDYAAAKAIEYGCQYFLSVGDIWDGDTLLNDDEPVFRVRTRYRDLARSMVCITLDGNHDPQGSLKIFEDTDHSVYFAPAQQGYNGEVIFSVLPYPTKAQLMRHLTAGQEESDETANALLRQILMGFNAQYGDCLLPHILLFHGNVRGCAVESGQLMYGGDVMISAQDLDLTGADYHALGHIHIHQVLGERSVYSGSITHRNYGERGYKYMVIADVWRGGYEMELIQLPSNPRVLIELDVQGDGTTLPAAGDVEAPLPGSDVKIRFLCTEEQRGTVDRKALAAAYAPDAAQVVFDPVVRPRERVRAEHIAQAKTLPEKGKVYAESVGVEVTAGIQEKLELVEKEVRRGTS